MHLYTNNTHTDGPKRHHQCCSFSIGFTIRQGVRAQKLIFFSHFPISPILHQRSRPKVSDRDLRPYVFPLSKAVSTHTPLMHEQEEEEGPRMDWARADAKPMGSMDGWLPAAWGKLTQRLNWPGDMGARKTSSVGSGMTTGLPILSPESWSAATRATHQRRAEKDRIRSAGYPTSRLGARSRSLPSSVIPQLPGRSTPSSAMRCTAIRGAG